MMQNRFRPVFRHAVVALAISALAVPAMPCPSQAAGQRVAVAATAFHAPVGSLVRCTSLRQPLRRPRPAPSRRSARYFAPTSQAVFFAHAGDRCVWRPGAPARG